MATGPRLSINCPHCLAKARVRTSREETILSKRLNFECSNFDCGHTFVAALDIIHTVRPSACPDPRVVLRQAPPRAIPAAANDDDTCHPRIMAGPEVPALRAANDDDPFPCAVATGG